jgi:hypothetical protein
MRRNVSHGGVALRRGSANFANLLRALGGTLGGILRAGFCEPRGPLPPVDPCRVDISDRWCTAVARAAELAWRH